ncbi:MULTISPECIES: conjugative transposon protein TraM [unclassified Arenibacter]|uniref:conjugative transposon protein TraM n=1 Tax=unclassified Arenibacter TaxID=2615047 RepID=UPI000E34CA9A|nr:MULTISPECIES: conjugative transposon protein TraM [unclassified Arenibacter]MCM4164858.1 conjugal transfer protein TraM [Arenibacter sp. A80]RFT55274.1 conjugative transposon protein TraM [Arenibacter sp. P308M17]
MKIERNKIVFGSVILVIVLFIVGYAMLVMDKGGDSGESLDKTEVPELEEQQKEYRSKLEAVDNIPEERVKNAPSIYDERLLDSTGLYDPDFMDRDKQRIVDSIYSQGRIDYSQKSYRNVQPPRPKEVAPVEIDTIVEEDVQPISTKELALEHQLFFAADPIPDQVPFVPDPPVVKVEVDGNQVVRTNSRLQLRLLQEIQLGKTKIPKNTMIYGIVSFGPNRTLLKIDNIDHIPVKLKAFDLQDGLEGIYVENSFRGEVANEVVDDVLDDINIAGVPQVSGIKKVFQRNNRRTKVAVLNNYKLILKSPEGP